MAGTVRLLLHLGLLTPIEPACAPAQHEFPVRFKQTRNTGWHTFVYFPPRRLGRSTHLTAYGSACQTTTPSNMTTGLAVAALLPVYALPPAPGASLWDIHPKRLRTVGRT